MNKPSIKCRVCWELKETNICVMITTKWAKESEKTIKDIILLCVPWMIIKDDSYLCKPCLWQLKFTYDFIERCLKTENILIEENNLGKLKTLEDIFKNSLDKGNGIQIIFENAVGIQPDDVAENTDDNLDLLGETAEASDDDIENINVKIRTPETTLPAEHDYCIRKGTQIDVNFIKNEQKDLSQSKEVPEKCNISDIAEKENISTTNDSLCGNDTEDFFSESNTAENDPDPPEPSILRTILGAKKKHRRSKTVLTKPDNPIISTREKLENELKELLDISPVDCYFLTTQTEMSAEDQDDLVRDGVNILNMSQNPDKKTRTIYLSRDLWKNYTKCSRCNMAFISRCDYMDHLRLHRRRTIKTAGEPIYTCKICSETFAVDIEFRTHTKRFHGIPSPHDCPKCPRRFKTHKMLRDHMEIFKDREKCVFTCTRCNAEFITNTSLIRHQNDVKDAPCCNYKKCRVCLEKFTKEDFKIHCSELHPNFLCPECGKSFLESVGLATHQKHVHNAVQTMCHECGKILSHERLLSHHMETVHGTGEKNYICDKCPQQFVCNRYLQKHMKKHLETQSGNNGKSKRVWRCDPCGKNYSKKETLRQHSRMFHLGIKGYTCTICNEGFTRKDYLKRHMRAHDKYIKNTCTICKKSFGSDWRLEVHMFAGHDENGKSLETGSKKQRLGIKVKRSYNKVEYQCVCKICSKVLANKSNLKNHYKAHLSIRESKCDICGVIFQGSLALNNHKKLHTNPNYQFSCKICHAYKSSSTELEIHMNAVHKNKKYKCSICSEAFGRKYLLLSHETIVHKEELHKREALLKMLQEDDILVPPNVTDKRRTNKGIKLGRLEVDVDTVLSAFANKKEDFEMVPGSSQGVTSAGEFYRHFSGNQATAHVPGGNNVTVLENEYEMMEDTRACRVLEEEISNNDLYISYRE